jgi:hypothetical protein
MLYPGGMSWIEPISWSSYAYYTTTANFRCAPEGPRKFQEVPVTVPAAAGVTFPWERAYLHTVSGIVFHGQLGQPPWHSADSLVLSWGVFPLMSSHFNLRVRFSLRTPWDAPNISFFFFKHSQFFHGHGRICWALRQQDLMMTPIKPLVSWNVQSLFKSRSIDLQSDTAGCQPLLSCSRFARKCG